MKMRSYNFCHTNTKNPGNNLGIFLSITGRPKLNGYGILLSAFLRAQILLFLIISVLDRIGKAQKKGDKNLSSCRLEYTV